MAFSGDQITRRGLYGGPRPLYGSFSGKSVDVQSTGELTRCIGRPLIGRGVRRSMIADALPRTMIARALPR